MAIFLKCYLFIVLCCFENPKNRQIRRVYQLRAQRKNKQNFKKMAIVSLVDISNVHTKFQIICINQFMGICTENRYVLGGGLIPP